MNFEENYQKLFKRDAQKSEREISFLESILPKEGLIIDAGCGDGFHAAALAEKGFKVLGIDQSKFMIDQAVSKNSKAEFLLGDLREMLIPKNNCTYSLFSSFGYEGYDSCLGNISGSLEHDGLLILDIHNIFSKVPHIPQETIEFEDHLISEKFDPITSIWTSDIEYPDGTAEKFSLRFFTPVEITGLLARHSISVEKVYGDFDANPYSTGSKRLIIVARKNL